MIDPGADRAVYRQLADVLRKRILAGQLGPGSALPSEEKLRQEYGVSRTTVRQAIAILRGEGLVVVDPPRGTFVRTVEPTETVTVGRGDSVSVRMPTPHERRELDLAEGVPVIVVTRAKGGTSTYPGDRTKVIVGR